MGARLAVAVVLMLVVPCAAGAQQPATGPAIRRAVGRPDPVVPADARTSAVSPVTILQVTIDTTGQVTEAQPVIGDEAFMQASLDAVRHWRFRPPDHAPATTLIGFNIALAQRPVPGGPIRNIPTWASAFVNRALMDQWGMPSMTLVPPVAMQTASGALIDVSIDANGTPVSACALGPIDQLTVPALQTALAWRFMGRSDGTTYLTMVSLHFTKQPRKIKDVKPVYPAAAMKNHVTGTVHVEVMIGLDGRVHDATVVQSVPGLDDAALVAVRQWVFAPALLDGIPVAQKSTITVAFALK